MFVPMRGVGGGSEGLLGGMKFGNWESRNINTVYKAATDGFVVTSNAPPSGVHYGYTDSNSNPTTLRTGNDGQGDVEGIMMPVRKGDYWRVYQPTPINTSNKVYWLPIISKNRDSDHFLISKNPGMLLKFSLTYFFCLLYSTMLIEIIDY